MSTTTQNAETIASKWFPGSNTIEVVVTRTAILDDSLSQIESRRLVDIRLSWLRGEQGLRVNRAEAIWLRDALTAAIDATTEFASKEETS